MCTYFFTAVELYEKRRSKHTRTLTCKRQFTSFQFPIHNRSSLARPSTQTGSGRCKQIKESADDTRTDLHLRITRASTNHWSAGDPGGRHLLPPGRRTSRKSSLSESPLPPQSRQCGKQRHMTRHRAARSGLRASSARNRIDEHLSHKALPILY